MACQKTDWGQIEWMDDSGAGLFQHGLKVGIVTMNIGSHHPPHKHYDEQVNYIIQGQAISLIDGEEATLTPGKFTHWSIGAVHEIYNIGNVPFVHLLISDSEGGEIENLLPFDLPDNVEEEQKPISSRAMNVQLFRALEAVRTQFLEILRFPYSIFDAEGGLISQSKVFPEFCRETCGGGQAQGGYHCLANENPKDFREEGEFFCPYRMQIINVPLMFNEQFMGYIQGGYFWQSKDGEKPREDVYDTPESTAIGIKKLLRRISRAIQNHCEFQQCYRELEEKTQQISSGEELKKNLIRNLQQAESEITDLKINHHFLFNTLNSMAYQAVESGAMPLYHSIVDLSKMFHYILRTQSMVVPLEKELEYVKAYLHLQSVRYGDELKILYNVDPECLNIQVPFNFLQPVVENAFIHGFSATVVKQIKINIYSQSDSVMILIQNTGKKMDVKTLEAINKKIVGKAPHGLSMIYYKLNSVYGKASKMQVETDENGNTCFRIQLPSQIPTQERS